MKIFISLCALVWLTAAVSGVAYMTKYANTPGESSDSYPLNFPAESRLERTDSLSTLILFAHPKCPCTRASLRELSRLMTDLDGKMQAFVVITKPAAADANWTETDLRIAAEAIPNTRVLIDEDERETKIFQAQTSGLTLLYDRDGKLRFEGGITASRGHEGGNAGTRAIFDAVTGNSENTLKSFVFDCLLNSKEFPGETAER